MSDNECDSEQVQGGRTDREVKQSVTRTAVRQLAEACAEAIFDEWEVGDHSRFCDEVEWDAAAFADVVERLERTLDANSETMREAWRANS